MKIALYARVSTTNHHQDPEVQLNEMRKWAFGQHETVAEYVDIVSGTKESRPRLDQMLADAKAKKFDAIVVWKLDRFGRSLKHLVNTITDLDNAGIKFISLRDHIDLGTPAGRLMFHMLGAMAQFERDLISERVKAGLKYTREVKGTRLGKQEGPNGPHRSTIWRRKQRAGQIAS